MIYKTIPNLLCAALGRAFCLVGEGWLHRKYSGDLSKLSDHMLRDIGLRREGDWVKFETRF